MTIDEKEEEIGLCSEIINLSVKFKNHTLRNYITEIIVSYRQDLRDQVILEKYNSDLKEVKDKLALQQNEGDGIS
jgi:hypothetical protein